MHETFERVLDTSPIIKTAKRDELFACIEACAACRAGVPGLLQRMPLRAAARHAASVHRSEPRLR
jgi:hypothetical protein